MMITPGRGARLEHTKETLVALWGRRCGRIEEVPPIAILHTPSGDTVGRFWPEHGLLGALEGARRGSTTVTAPSFLPSARKSGQLLQPNLSRSHPAGRVYPQGRVEETFEPHFTFSGFSLRRRAGFQGTDLGSLTGVVIYSAGPQTAGGKVRIPLLNQLQQQHCLGTKGQFPRRADGFPQRDERLGWTENAQAFVRNRAFNMDVAGFFTNGCAIWPPTKRQRAVPVVVSDVIRPGKIESTVPPAGDVATIAPWTIHLITRHAHPRDAICQHEAWWNHPCAVPHAPVGILDFISATG